MSSTALSWRKRSLSLESSSEPSPKSLDPKRARNEFAYYIKLESESNTDTNDDTESICSLQGKETDVVRDTSDTDGDDFGDDYVNLEIEFDIDDSLSESDGEHIIEMGSSTESEELFAAAVAAVACDSNLETFVTDAEDSDNSYQQDDTSIGLTDFGTCIQCKSDNNNPKFRFCDRCFQDRKTFFPPRPRRHKRKETKDGEDDESEREKKQPVSPVKLSTLKSCLSGLSQDSGIGSSQEFQSLALDQIIVPSTSPDCSSFSTRETSEKSTEYGTNRKRQLSESSLDEEYSAPSVKRSKIIVKDEEIISSGKEEIVTNVDEQTRELCIICNSTQTNSVFVHGRSAHMSCCYRCAMRTWKSAKRCPICNRKVSNVLRVFRS